MEPSIFSVISKKVITTVISIGSLFYSTIIGVNAEFDEIELLTKGNYIAISTYLTNCYSEDLDQIFYSGQEIKIHYAIQVIHSKKGNSVYEYKFYHSIKYSLLDGIFEVYRTESEERFDRLNLEQAKSALTEINEYLVISADKLKNGKNYIIKLTAWMEEIQLKGMEEPLNLMYYWNSIRPTRESGSFTTEVFQQ